MVRWRKAVEGEAMLDRFQRGEIDLARMDDDDGVYLRELKADPRYPLFHPFKQRNFNQNVKRMAKRFAAAPPDEAADAGRDEAADENVGAGGVVGTDETGTTEVVDENVGAGEVIGTDETGTAEGDMKKPSVSFVEAVPVDVAVPDDVKPPTRAVVDQPLRDEFQKQCDRNAEIHSGMMVALQGFDHRIDKNAQGVAANKEEIVALKERTTNVEERTSNIESEQVKSAVKAKKQKKKVRQLGRVIRQLTFGNPDVESLSLVGSSSSGGRSRFSFFSRGSRGSGGNNGAGGQPKDNGNVEDGDGIGGDANLVIQVPDETLAENQVASPVSNASGIVSSSSPTEPRGGLLSRFFG